MTSPIDELDRLFAERDSIQEKINSLVGGKDLAISALSIALAKTKIVNRKLQGRPSDIYKVIENGHVRRGIPMEFLFDYAHIVDDEICVNPALHTHRDGKTILL